LKVIEMSRSHLILNSISFYVAFVLALPVAHANGISSNRATALVDQRHLRVAKPSAHERSLAGSHSLKDHEEQELERSMKWRGVKLASLAGASTGIGGLVVLFFPQGPPSSLMAFGMSLAAGAMITISSMLLVTVGRGIWWFYAMFACGFMLTHLLIKMTTHLEEIESSPVAEKQASAPGAWRLAILLVLSLSLHRLPEGMAVGVSSLQGKAESITMGIAIHNIPEGIVIALAVYGATHSQWKTILLVFLSGIPEPLGAFISCFALRNVADVDSIDFLQMLVAGVMVYISVMELLPEACAIRKTFWTCGGFVSGVLVMAATEMALKA